MVDVDLLQDPRRIAHHDHIIGHILGHHAPRADCNTSADSHAGKHNAVAAEPAVLPDLDRLAGLRSVDPVAQRGVERMRAAVEGAVGSE